MKESIKTIVQTLMHFYGLTQKEFSEKFKLDPSQVTRWLYCNQTPRLDSYFNLKYEYDKIKDNELPILKDLM